MCSTNALSAVQATITPASTGTFISRTKFGKTETGKGVSKFLKTADPAGTIGVTATDRRSTEKFKDKATELVKGKKDDPAALPATPVPDTDEGERQRRLSELRLRRRRGVGSTKINTGLGLLGTRAQVGKQATIGA